MDCVSGLKCQYHVLVRSHPRLSVMRTPDIEVTESCSSILLFLGGVVESLWHSSQLSSFLGLSLSLLHLSFHFNAPAIVNVLGPCPGCFFHQGTFTQGWPAGAKAMLVKEA